MRKSIQMLMLMLVMVVPLVAPSQADARVVRFVVEQKQVIVDGKSWDAVGPYERLDGTAYFEVDPRDPLNAVIVNLAKAPKNAKGMVEFSSPFAAARSSTRGGRCCRLRARTTTTRSPRPTSATAC